MDTATNQTELLNSIKIIKGVGEYIANTIVTERHALMADLITISEMSNVIHSYGVKQDNGIQIRFSGVRDANLEKQFRDAGYDCDSNKGVTNKTNILIVPYLGFTSSKVAKAMKNNIRIMTIAEAASLLNN